MASLAILGVIMLAIFGVTRETGKIWKSSTAKIEAFQGARLAFESLTRRLSQSTLNGYYDYFDANGHSSSHPSYNGTPSVYGRQSELHFISGPDLLSGSILQVTHAVFFQAPLGYANSDAWSGLESALNAVGYYVTYNDDAQAGNRPGFITPTLSPLKYRFRLMQFTQSLQNLEIFKPANVSGTGWFVSGTSPAGNAASTRPLADNIVALVILPRKSNRDDPGGTALCPDYSYDSRRPWTGPKQPEQMNQLPPLLQVVMVAIDEPSAQRVCTGATAPDFGLGSLFKQASGLEADLSTLEASLSREKLTYKIFRADIGIRGAKWSN